jgi:hypothetical protein
MRLLRLDLGGRQIRNALTQQDFNGAQLGHGQANLTEGALVEPIDKLTGSDFFPDVIGMGRRPPSVRWPTSKEKAPP